VTCAKEPEAAGVKRIYRGYLRLVRHTSDNREDGPTFLAALGAHHDDECSADENTPLASQLMKAAVRHGRRLKVRFVTGADRHDANPKDPFGPGWTENVGVLDADGSLVKGTVPGRWIVREKIIVGGQNLLKSLRTHADKFCHMEVTYMPPDGEGGESGEGTD
jgi:hypothetical protein